MADTPTPTPLTPTPNPTVTYVAKSAFVSKTQIFNAAAVVLNVLAFALVNWRTDMPELQQLLSPAHIALVDGTIVPIVNMILRMYSVRPVAMIAPGNTALVSVPKL